MDLQPIKDALAAATPGPWGALTADNKHEVNAFCGGFWAIQVCSLKQGKLRNRRATQADADLIANAPRWLWALVLEVERLRAEAGEG